MSNNKEALQCLVPHYYEDFHCTGAKCAATCCTSSWKIFIDKKTYDKYKSIRNPEFKELIDGKIKRVKGETKTNTTYAIIKGDENGLCSILDDSGLCRIQKSLGEQALCITCRIFPRRQLLMRFDNLFETGYTMACPEVVKLALFNENGISFKKTVIGNGTILATTPRRLIEKHSDGWRRMLFDVRDICISILQYKKSNVANRLMALNMYLNKLDTATNTGDALVISEGFLDILGKGGFDNLLGTFAENEAISTQMEEVIYRDIILLYENRVKEHAKNTHLFKNFIDFVNKIDNENKVVYESKKYVIHEYLVEKAKIGWSDFLQNRSYILENYFVTLVWNNLIPISTGENTLSMYESAFTFATQYAKLKLLITTNAEDYGGITDELVTDVAVLMSRNYEHGSEKLNIFDYYKENDILTLAHCSFLLR